MKSLLRALPLLCALCGNPASAATPNIIFILADDTLLVFTSDNGCSPIADIPDLTQKGQGPN